MLDEFFMLLIWSKTRYLDTTYRSECIGVDGCDSVVDVEHVHAQSVEHVYRAEDDHYFILANF